MRGVRRAVMIAVLGLVVGVPPAAAFQGPWVLPPTDLSGPDQYTFEPPQLAVAPDGTTTVVWSRRGSGTDFVVLASTRSPGGGFSAAADLSTVGESAVSPQVAVGPDGTTTVVWTRSVDGKDIVQASTRLPGKAFSAPVDISVPGQDAGGPHVAVAPGGTTTVVWSAYDATRQIAQASTRPPGGAFGAPVELSPAGQNGSPQVAVAPDGTTTAVWARYNTTESVVQASTRPPGGAFGAPVDVSATGQNGSFPQVAVAPDGETTVVWDRFNGTDTTVQASTRTPGGAFAAPVDLETGDALPARLAVAPDGTTTVVWSHSTDDTHEVIRASTRPPGGTFTGPVDISAPALSADLPQVVVAPDGTTTAVWQRYDGDPVRVQASTRTPGGAFTEPVDLSAAGHPAVDVQVAVAPDGTATAVWNLNDSNVVQAASTSNGPPVLRTAPVTSGSAALGARLGCDGGSWAGATSVTTGWLRGAALIGAGPSYTTTSADQGTALSCRARASNQFGSVEALSAPVSIPAASLPAVATPPIARSLPRITGSARLGRTLRCKQATFTAAARRTTSWLRAAKPIKGARKSTYKITKKDLGKIITCRTTATGPGGTSTLVSLGTRARR